MSLVELVSFYQITFHRRFGVICSYPNLRPCIKMIHRTLQGDESAVLAAIEGHLANALTAEAGMPDKLLAKLRKNNAGQKIEC